MKQRKLQLYKDFSDYLLAKQMGIIILQLEYGTVNSGAELPRIIIPIWLEPTSQKRFVKVEQTTHTISNPKDML